VTSDRSPIVGRDRHLRELRLLIDSVRHGRGNLVVLSGDAGLGKTRLAEAAVDLAGEAGVDAWWTACWSNAAGPLSVWTDALEALGGSAPAPARLRADSERDPAIARDSLVRDVSDRVLRATQGRPCLLVLDDLQWADPLSVRVLLHLAPRLHTRGLAIVATLRVNEDSVASPLLDEAVQAGRYLEVAPLTKQQLAELVALRDGSSLSEAGVAEVFARTGGNVLAAIELLADDADVGRAGGSIFTRRLGALSEAAGRVVVAAAVIGRQFRVDVVAEMLSTAVDDVLDALGEAQEHHLVREAGIGRWAFVHPLVAEAAYTSVGLARRVRLHRDAGEALERFGDRGVAVPAAELAHHFAHAASGGAADKAAQYAERAAAEAMTDLAYEDAAFRFRQALAALELCPADDGRRGEVLLGLGGALAAAGDLPESRTVYEHAAQLARARGWPERLGRAALGVGSGTGSFEVAPFDHAQIELVEEALTVLAPGALRARLLAQLSVALSLNGDHDRRRDLSMQAAEMARDSDDPAALGYALASLCDVLAAADHGAERVAITAEIVACAARAGDTQLELLGRRHRVVALLETGRTDEVDLEIAAFAKRAEALQQPLYQWYAPLWRGMRAAMSGRIDAATGLCQQAATAGSAAHSENAEMLSGSQRIFLRCECGDPDPAVEFCVDIAARWPEYVVMARPPLAYAAAHAGDADLARQTLAQVSVEEYDRDASGSEWLPMLATLAEAVSLTADVRLAEPLYRTLLPFRSLHAVDGIGDFDFGVVERHLGLLAGLLGDLDGARAHFAAALAAHESIGAELLAARTELDAGRVLDDDAMRRAARSRYAAIGVPGPHLELDAAPLLGDTGTGTGTGDNVFRRDGDTWLVGLVGAATRVRHTKGMSDLARLLRQPGIEVHVLDLVTEGATVISAAPGEVIDADASRQYKARLVTLETELDEADSHNDIERSTRLHAERDALVTELSAAYGLGGRARRTGDNAERARSAVTQRIREAIARIDAHDPALGQHLRHSVTTGIFCAYRPERDTPWQLGAPGGGSLTS